MIGILAVFFRRHLLLSMWEEKGTDTRHLHVLIAMENGRKKPSKHSCQLLPSSDERNKFLANQQRDIVHYQTITITLPDDNILYALVNHKHDSASHTEYRMKRKTQLASISSSTSHQRPRGCYFATRIGE